MKQIYLLQLLLILSVLALSGFVAACRIRRAKEARRSKRHAEVRKKILETYAETFRRLAE